MLDAPDYCIGLRGAALQLGRISNLPASLGRFEQNNRPL